MRSRIAVLCISRAAAVEADAVITETIVPRICAHAHRRVVSSQQGKPCDQAVVYWRFFDEKYFKVVLIIQ